MHLTDKSRLILLIEALADSEKSRRRRKNAGRTIAKYYPPKRRTDLYANALRDARLSDRGRWIVMLMLFYVGNDASVRGLIAFLDDPEMPKMLKLNAATLLFSLNPRLKLPASPNRPKFPLAWLSHGVSTLPSASEQDRRAFVFEQLLIDLFEERSLP